ncbi:MAG: tRNA ((7)-)-methyltransferase [Anaerocolumna sp.]|nr:tRNA ((7)-)-methyltransferase [Anaerocolumna sp.]
MRLRNVKGSREAIAENEFVVQNPEECRGKWRSNFGNEHPIHIEIGMGKGKFLLQLAQSNPDINYIGIEKYSSVLIRAIEKRKEISLTNLYFLRFDAEDINDIFEEGEIDRVYLNFSDPW